jgi:hypothetical protein
MHDLFESFLWIGAEIVEGLSRIWGAYLKSSKEDLNHGDASIYS